MAFGISRQMHDAALAMLRRRGLTDMERYNLEQVANGFVGLCDQSAALFGLRWIETTIVAEGGTPFFRAAEVERDDDEGL